jgi:hypothetical protein
VKKKKSVEGSMELQGVAEGHELIYKHALGGRDDGPGQQPIHARLFVGDRRCRSG